MVSAAKNKDVAVGFVFSESFCEAKSRFGKK